MATSKRDRLARQLGKSGLLLLLESAALRPRLLVLTYHRIGLTDDNPFDDGVYSATPEGFRAQVRYLRHHFDLPRYDDLIPSAENNFLFQGPTALITFDDGYRDNYEWALPILQEFGVPALFFIPTGYIGRARLPAWDRIAFVIKQTQEREIRLEIPEPLRIDLSQVSRSAAIARLIRAFRSAEAPDELAFFEQLEQRARVPVDPEALGRPLFMSWDEIRQMAAAGMSIGSHTHNHPMLSRLSEPDQWDELTRSKQLLERELGRAIATISYPFFGAHVFNTTTKRLAHEAGYRLGFSFYGGINRPGRSDLFDVRRIDVESDESFQLFRSRMIFNNIVGSSF